MSNVLTSVWFRIGLFVSLLLIVGLKFWWSRRKYLRQEAERQREQSYTIRSGSGADTNSIVLVESNSTPYQIVVPGRNFRPVPPPEFDDAIKFCEKVAPGPEDEPPPSYNDYIKAVEAGDGDDHDPRQSQPSEHAEIPSVHGRINKEYQKEGAVAVTGTATGACPRPPDVENHL